MEAVQEQIRQYHFADEESDEAGWESYGQQMDVNGICVTFASGCWL